MDVGATPSPSTNFMKPLKMYIVVRESLPSHKMVAVAHGVLMAHRAFYTKKIWYDEWLDQSFRKVVCEANDSDFEIMKQFPDHVVVTESGLGGQEVALVFCPRQEWPKPFQFLRMSKY